MGCHQEEDCSSPSEKSQMHGKESWWSQGGGISLFAEFYVTHGTLFCRPCQYGQTQTSWHQTRSPDSGHYHWIQLRVFVIYGGNRRSITHFLYHWLTNCLESTKHVDQKHRLPDKNIDKKQQFMGRANDSQVISMDTMWLMVSRAALFTKQLYCYDCSEMVVYQEYTC